jgi:hypothetical protein
MRHTRDTTAWLSRIALSFAMTLPGLVHPSDRAPDDRAFVGSRWTPFVRGGYLHQFDTDLDDGGNFNVDRLFIRGGVSYSAAPRRRVSLAAGFGRDRYDFSGNTDFAGLRPWKRVNRLRFSVPVNWAVDDHWTRFFLPTLRFYGESGADLEDSATGGGLAGFSYRFGDALTLGPGLGVLTRLEDSVNVFPILIIDWQITERLSLKTGRGLGATQGPGLTLNYRVSDTWNLALGGRYESLRFRLDDSGPAPDGVGEDRSFPLYLSATYNRGRDLQLSLIGGVELGGTLRLDDSKGRRIAKEDYDTAPFLGFNFNFRF